MMTVKLATQPGDIITEMSINLRNELDTHQNRDIKNSIAGILHEITRELQCIEQQQRIFDNLLNKE